MFTYRCMHWISLASHMIRSKNKIVILFAASIVVLTTNCSALLDSNSCRYAFDGECDDGGPGSQFSVCAYGTDLSDCGSRYGSPVCSIPDGSSRDCDCNIDADCPSGYFCDEGTGFDACVRSNPGDCSIPDGSSSNCDCDSDSDCPSGYFCDFRSGHDPCMPMDTATISDGTLLGLNGRNIRTTINVEPNSGPLGTPVQLTITFSVGGGDVEAIETWQNTVTFGGFVRTEFDPLGFRLDPTRQSSSVWTNANLFLTGVSAVVRYIAVNSSGERIALGEIDVNGGL